MTNGGLILRLVDLHEKVFPGDLSVSEYDDAYHRLQEVVKIYEKYESKAG